MLKLASIGIDIGGSKTLFALFNSRMRLIDEIKLKTANVSQREFAHVLTECVEKLVKTSVKRDLTLSAIGIGCAGSVDSAKKILKKAPNVPALAGFPFSSVFQKVTHAPVYVYNDAYAGLYGEMQCGAAAGHKHVLAVFIGTGVGAAVAVDGKLCFGASGQAGNLGRFLIHPLAQVAGTEHVGSLDEFASRTAIAAEAAALAARYRAPHLLKISGTDVKSIKSSALAKAIRLGDTCIEELVRSRARMLGIALSNIVEFLNPEMIVIGGGLTQALPVLIRDEVEAGIKTHATPEAAAGLQIVTSKLKNHAVTLGAAKLALDET